MKEKLFAVALESIKKSKTDFGENITRYTSEAIGMLKAISLMFNVSYADIKNEFDIYVQKQMRSTEIRIEGKYILGTAKEIAELLVGNILNEDKIITYSSVNNFRDCDFAIVENQIKDKSLVEIYESSDCFFGIKKIQTGFDSNDLELFADYYGGGAGVYHSIFNGNMDIKECEGIIYGLIKGTLEKNGSYSDDFILIAEYV